MAFLDWLVLVLVLGFISLYGWYRTKQNESLQGFVLGGQESVWWKVGLGVMATQASAITFISTTGQGFSDGLRFVQFYFGLPLAMWVIMYYFIPVFYKMKVLTAYEYLEQRFDIRVRVFASVIFLIQRGLAAGITLYAPAIILSAVMDWNLQYTQIISGLLVIFYTVSGGSKAVTVTQIQQMAIILLGMLFVFIFILYHLTQELSVSQILHLAGNNGRLDGIDFSLNFEDRYNFWSGITGGFFLALAYFGTDQSQVQRYLSGKNKSESQMGLFFNGLVKIPMQIFILLTGVLLFVFFQMQKTPMSYNEKLVEELKSNHQDFYNTQSYLLDSLQLLKKNIIRKSEIDLWKVNHLNKTEDSIRSQVKAYVQQNSIKAEANDRDYIFLYFILHYLPQGMIGLLLAVILCAAMSSISAELNALAATSSVDLKNRLFPNFGMAFSDLQWSKIFTVFWGLVAIGFAFYAKLFDNLIQYINIIGSLFYGSVLGIFITAFFFPRVAGTAVFLSAVLAQVVVFFLFAFSTIGFLWYNVIAAVIVVIFSQWHWVFPKFLNTKNILS